MATPWHSQLLICTVYIILIKFCWLPSLQCDLITFFSRAYAVHLRLCSNLLVDIDSRCWLSCGVIVAFRWSLDDVVVCVELKYIVIPFTTTAELAIYRCLVSMHCLTTVNTVLCILTMI